MPFESICHPCTGNKGKAETEMQGSQSECPSLFPWYLDQTPHGAVFRDPCRFSLTHVDDGDNNAKCSPEIGLNFKTHCVKYNHGHVSLVKFANIPQVSAKFMAHYG